MLGKLEVNSRERCGGWGGRGHSGEFLFEVTRRRKVWVRSATVPQWQPLQIGRALYTMQWILFNHVNVKQSFLQEACPALRTATRLGCAVRWALPDNSTHMLNNTCSILERRAEPRASVFWANNACSLFFGSPFVFNLIKVAFKINKKVHCLLLENNKFM